LFDQRGIVPRRTLGQNFLVDLNIHDLIVRTADVGPKDVILEVGSGTGALTALMASRGAAVVAVEIDLAMAQLTAEVIARLPNVRVLQVDVLRHKNAINPVVLDSVRAGLAAGSGKTFKLVANLPYRVATPVIINLLTSTELCPELMVVTIQRELAERLCAAPASAAYGAASVLVQALADVSTVRLLPPSVFWPRPQVDSAVVLIGTNAKKRDDVGDVAWFHELVRRVFIHRRKYLRHVLAGIWREQWTRLDVDAWLDKIGLNGQIRAEALDVEEFIALARALRDTWSELPGIEHGGKTHRADERQRQADE
jgi:16S rRNA (adenine1518-N6/adenine1519-N6)-dimethyltransferase